MLVKNLNSFGMFLLHLANRKNINKPEKKFEISENETSYRN